MKSFQEFLLESVKVDSIEKLNDVCKKIIVDSSEKIDIPLGLLQQAITIMESPFPHIHCEKSKIEDGLEDNKKFLADECCKTCAAMAEDYGLEAIEVKKDDPHGAPGDILLKATF